MTSIDTSRVLALDQALQLPAVQTLARPKANSSALANPLRRGSIVPIARAMGTATLGRAGPPAAADGRAREQKIPAHRCRVLGRGGREVVGHRRSPGHGRPPGVGLWPRRGASATRGLGGARWETVLATPWAQGWEMTVAITNPPREAVALGMAEILTSGSPWRRSRDRCRDRDRRRCRDRCRRRDRC